MIRTPYVATHFGLFLVPDAGKPTRIADRWQDTMAFTITEQGWYAATSTEAFRSTDRGDTWEQVL